MMIQFLRRRRAAFAKSEQGFTLVEMMSAMLLTGIFMALTMANIFSVRQIYLEDIVRLRVNSNLRSAMDMLAMNVRQAGENLQGSFPSIILEDGGSGVSDTLRLRRNLIPEVLTLCQAATVGSTAVYVSANSLSDPECVGSNVQSLFDAFETYRDAQSSTVRVYIYDRINEIGEFVNYTNENEVGGEHYLVTAPLVNAYDPLTTNIYMLEEFMFETSMADQTLNLYLNQDMTIDQAVAFEITNFQVGLLLQDGSTVTSLDTSSAYGWQDIEQVTLTLSGSDSWKSKTVDSSLTATYFPRNVLSDS